MKFRFYITDLYNGSVKGTNNCKLANELAQSEEHFVVDSEEGIWLQTGGDSCSITDIEEEVVG